MAIFVSPTPKTLSWENFTPVSSLPDEDAHIRIQFDVPNRPFRKVDGVFKMADTFQIVVKPVAQVLRTASRTAALLSHEQGHYNIGILAAHAMAREFETLEAASPKELAALINASFDLHTVTRMKAIQEKYDKDTDHSQKKDEQKRWDDMISTCLSSPSACATLDKLPL